MRTRVEHDLPRTNNAVESWHRSFQFSIQCVHPTVWRLLGNLKKEHGLQETVLAQTMAGLDPMRRNKQYARINKAIAALCAKEESGEIPTIDFLRGCSYNLEMNV